VSDSLIIVFFLGCFGFVWVFVFYRFWNFVQLRALAAQQGWTLVGKDRSGWNWLAWFLPLEYRVFAIEGEGWRYAAISRLTGVKTEVSRDGVRMRPTRRTKAVWSSAQGGSPHSVLLVPMQKSGHDPLDNVIIRALFDPGELATEIAQLVAEDYPAGEKLSALEGRSIADYAVYTSDEDTADRLLQSSELGAVLAEWSNETYAHRPGVLLYPGGVRLSTQQVETRPKQVHRLVELGEELVRITAINGPD
jgi:hypothetical protein